MQRLWSKSQRRYGTMTAVVFRDDTGLEHTVPLDDVEWVQAPTDEAFEKFAEQTSVQGEYTVEQYIEDEIPERE